METAISAGRTGDTLLNSSPNVLSRRPSWQYDVTHACVVVLQMPVVTHSQGWLLNYVLDNYRRNGFRLGVSAVDA